jgi:hypothetical protein
LFSSGVLLNGETTMLALTTIGKSGNYHKNMRALFVTAIILTSAASLWAQGQIVVTGSEVLEAVPFKDIGVIEELPVISLPTSSDWLPPSQRFSLAESSRLSDRISLSPLPPINSSDVEITATTITLISVNFEPPVNLSSTISFGQVNYGGDSSGAEMIEASRTKGFIDIPAQPILPPTPDLQIQFSQASEIQPAPEPSTFALGSLALGLIALFRASLKTKNVA